MAMNLRLPASRRLWPALDGRKVNRYAGCPPQPANDSGVTGQQVVDQALRVDTFDEEARGPDLLDRIVETPSGPPWRSAIMRGLGC